MLYLGMVNVSSVSPLIDANGTPWPLAELRPFDVLHLQLDVNFRRVGGSQCERRRSAHVGNGLIKASQTQVDRADPACHQLHIHPSPNCAEPPLGSDVVLTTEKLQYDS